MTDMYLDAAPPTRPIPMIPKQGAHAVTEVEEADTPIYDELVSELGNPCTVDEDYATAQDMHAEAVEGFKKLIRDAYL